MNRRSRSLRVDTIYARGDFDDSLPCHRPSQPSGSTQKPRPTGNQVALVLPPIGDSCRFYAPHGLVSFHRDLLHTDCAFGRSRSPPHVWRIPGQTLGPLCKPGTTELRVDSALRGRDVPTEDRTSCKAAHTIRHAPNTLWGSHIDHSPKVRQPPALEGTSSLIFELKLQAAFLSWVTADRILPPLQLLA